MDFPLVKLFTRLLARAWQPTHTGRAAAGVICALASVLAILPARAQIPDDDGTPSASVPSGATPELGLLPDDDPQDVPHVQLTTQIVYQVLAAEVAFQRGQPAPAYQTYLALAHETQDPRMAERAAQIALGAQSPTDALNAAQLWRQYAPHSERASQLDASLLVLSGKLEDARPIIVSEMARTPEGARGDAILALQILLSQGPDRMSSLHLLQDILASDMQRPEANLAIARQQINADDQPGARKSLEKALSLRPDYVPAAALLAQLGPDAHKEAMASLSRTVRREPASRDARLALAQLYLLDNQVGAAQEQFEALRKLDPDDLMPLMALGLLQIQQKHYDQAQSYLKEYAQKARNSSMGSRIDPGQAYLYLSQIALERHDVAAASNWLDKVAPTSAQYVPARITRAQLLAKQGKTDDARQLLAFLHPASPREQALIARTDGAVLFDAKRYKEAEKRLAQATQAYPGDAEVRYDYAMAAEKNGRYDVMEKQLRRLIELQPDNAQAYNALGYSLADRGQHLDEASQLIAHAVALAPNNPYIIDSAGWVKYRSGDRENAEKLLRQALSIQPNAEIGAHLGEVLWTSGKHDEARAVWRQAKQLDPRNDTLAQTLKRFQINDL